MNINNVAVWGAGAVGAYFIETFAAAGDSFCVVAEGERKARLERDGISINHKTVRPCIKTPDEAYNPDLLIVAFKYDGLLAALPDFKRIVGPDTVILSVMNGIDSEELIEQQVGPGHVVYSYIYIISSRDGTGSICFDRAATVGVTYGEKDGSFSPRLNTISALFTAYDIHHTLSTNIRAGQWYKYAMNISNNLLQAVLNTGYGAYYDSEHMGFLRDAMLREVKQVAAAEGITVENLPTGRSDVPPASRFSTLQDLDAGRKTEVDMFLGVLMKLAAKHSIEVPYSTYTYHAIKVLEEKQDGKFNY